jgi:protein tyrosine phosphatase (PTP) superfamily phosphohydrolase (DUF442 family)
MHAAVSENRRTENMFGLIWLRKRGVTRGTPARDDARDWRRPALGLVVVLTLLQSGCQSGASGCGGGLCGSCGFFNRVSSRVFNRTNRNGDCCTSAVVGSGTPIEYGTSSSMVVPPASPPYAVSPGTTTTPSIPDTPESLDAIPKYKIGPPTGNGTSSSTVTPKQSSYQTRMPAATLGSARYRNENVARTMAATSEPTSRSAQTASAGEATGASASDDQDPLDHLPPLDLPGEVTRTNTPATTTAVVKPDAAPKPEEPAKKKPEPRLDSPPPAVDAKTSATTVPSAEPVTSASVGPGLTRFVAVDLKLAGGAAPSAAGLQWLAEKGYRTLLDLREPSEVPPWFITEVTNKGLRYVALPMSLKTIDRDHVDRFHFEIAAGEARPLFFFDANGSRAGALWYVRRILVDRVDTQVARREAEELGLVDKSAWLSATDYVDKITSTREGSKSAEPRSTSSSSPGPSTSMVPGTTPTSVKPASTEIAQASPGQTQPPPASVVNTPAPAVDTKRAAVNAIPEKSSTPNEQSIPGDPVAWRPFAALVITGLSLPLAYWTRSIVPTILSKTRASLPSPALRPRSLPDGSGD